jgi:hypothetical protein
VASFPILNIDFHPNLLSAFVKRILDNNRRWKVVEENANLLNSFTVLGENWSLLFRHCWYFSLLQLYKTEITTTIQTFYSDFHVFVIQHLHDFTVLNFHIFGPMRHGFGRWYWTAAVNQLTAALNQLYSSSQSVDSCSQSVDSSSQSVDGSSQSVDRN